MNSKSIVELFKRRFIYLGIFAIGVVCYFVYSTILPNLASVCVYPSPNPDHGYPKGIKNGHKFVEISKNVFVREKFHVIQLINNSLEATTINLLLNSRKLTLFAVHELNRQLCADIKPCTIHKWWADPLNTLAIKTSSFANYSEHGVTFMGEPGSVPFYALIKQNHIPPSGANWTELEILGKFVRLDGEAIGPPGAVNSTDQVNQDDKSDPELFSWPRNKSFMVGDYVDFKDAAALYPISPGGTGNVTREQLYCGDALKILVMVSSAPLHFEQRKTIRETYANRTYLNNLKARVVFLFGLVGNATLQAKLSAEALEHSDIIQAAFMDSYHNLSLSHLSMYNWIQTTCEGAGLALPRYILKADDDFVLNVELASKVAYANPEYEFIGTSFCHTGPIRDTNYMYKYYTPRYMHMPNRYAGYLSGVAYLVRTDVIPRMLRISLTTPMIHMDDAYITGILPRQINLWPVGSPLFTYGRSKLDACSMKKMVCSYILSSDDMRAQWAEFVKPVPPDCNLTAAIDPNLKVVPLDDGFRKFCDYI